ncbi:hypothetical protein Tco_0625860 [Tanacetum coccineum]|uniref:Uncharacterized protein n=1 Tax=Tanacetum coccineum TaxID=301880 RepID=A0ABQ4WHY7_9ASTR
MIHHLIGTLRGVQANRGSQTIVAGSVTDPTPMQTSSEVANPRVSLALVETCSRRPGKEPMQLDDMEGRRQPDKGRKPPKSGTKEKIVANDNYPE